ncbi:hydroxyisourate hydrolase [Algisphaera agarilytica]|uniref:5-hydroxyisourate hydrolase n=1 Tax=Algisphaera agarilytica TaxID=1385975 RepID=A0A7X0H7J7_9BACT|nr:hydroxyisourate hydrolase [Algisphaera agarilytica]MBB6429576.1 5-hydroxyisourate hydrolase [Algisphaera agarilytica]
MSDSPLTTHVLDTALGKPAAGMRIVLERAGDEGYEQIAAGTTNQDGRITDLIPADEFTPGQYLIHFDTSDYFATSKRETFYPEVAVLFTVKDAGQHHHVPLLVSPFGYSTYRGS